MTLRLLSLVAAVALVAGCGKLEEANQGKGYAGKADTHPSASGNTPFSDGGWTSGDKEGWSSNLATRAKGQNEYVRTNPAGAGK